MKKVCGFAMFWMAAGMLVMMLLPNLVCGIILMLILLAGAYKLFCC